MGQMPPMGQMPEGMEMPKILTPEEKTAEMAEKYGLSEEQQTALLALNQKYDGKLEIRMAPQGEQRDFRKMSDEERQQFMNEMMSQMSDMQEKQAQVEKNQKAYEEELKNILDKKQLRKYRTDQRRAEAERQAAMQRGFGGGMPGGGMMPPGGGFPGGGFPGGGFPGGF
ncbi:MAG: DUF4890 domain-containing protein [Bacteroidales bacterium]|nr:DUF4890 domain-containing protein [Bacteroidales bacterium]